MGGFDESMKEIAGKATVIVIIVLILAILFVLFIHLYAKWFWWRVEGPRPGPYYYSSRSLRPHRHQFVFVTDSQEHLPRGLEVSMLRSLPVVIFQAKDFEHGRLDCAVCLCEVADGEKARLLPECNHGFHVDCIDMWFQSNSTCPLCRCPVVPPTEPPKLEDDHGLGPTVGSGFQSLQEFLGRGDSPKSVLVAGDDRTHNQERSYHRGMMSRLEEGTSTITSGSSIICVNSTSSSANITQDNVLVIDIPDQIHLLHG